PAGEYQDDQVTNLFAKLINRVKVEPFNLVASLIFLCAIVHTFLTSKFMHISHAYRHEYQALEVQESKTGIRHSPSVRTHFFFGLSCSISWAKLKLCLAFGSYLFF